MGRAAVAAWVGLLLCGCAGEAEVQQNEEVASDVEGSTQFELGEDADEFGDCYVVGTVSETDADAMLANCAAGRAEKLAATCPVGRGCGSAWNVARQIVRTRSCDVLTPEGKTPGLLTQLYRQEVLVTLRTASSEREPNFAHAEVRNEQLLAECCTPIGSPAACAAGDKR